MHGKGQVYGAVQSATQRVWYQFYLPIRPVIGPFTACGGQIVKCLDSLNKLLLELFVD